MNHEMNYALEKQARYKSLFSANGERADLVG